VNLVINENVETFVCIVYTCAMNDVGRSNMLLQKRENQARYNRAKQQNNPYESTVCLATYYRSIFMPLYNVMVFVLFVRACVRPWVRPETLLTRYLVEYLTHFHQTYISNALWDR